MKVVCFCHLRWNFVYQRPQHLLTRFAQRGEVYLWEEPLYRSQGEPTLEITTAPEGVHVLTPVLPENFGEFESIRALRQLLNAYMGEQEIGEFVAWYYTPMALRFSDHLSPWAVVYDCMDELSAFQCAPPVLIKEEQRLFDRADIVFAGGASLYAAKKKQHKNVHLFPSSIDYEHFEAARRRLPEPIDHVGIPHPRIGFYGVLDERLDSTLLRAISTMRPDWHFVLLGPVVKIQEEDLPRANNLHYLGQKSYADLPAYLSHWDVAMLPFARNESTRFISPTKTPEYLAGGRPVVSTPITDVVKPYGEMDLVYIGESPEQFALAIMQAMERCDSSWQTRVDAFLAGNSWDQTFEAMWKEIARMKVPPPARSVNQFITEGVAANV